jgi:hypothetical protein
MIELWLAATAAAAQPSAVGVVHRPGVQQPASAPAEVGTESPEEIARDAERDLKDSRFYNRPGATRAEYDADWQECRLIARGSRTPGGTIAFVYNPAIISPVAAGAAGGIGAAIGQAIAEGRARRANRRTCLLIRGWQLVEVDEAEQARIAAMSDAARDAFFNEIVGAAEVGGRKITVWRNDFAAPRLAAESEQ